MSTANIRVRSAALKDLPAVLALHDRLADHQRDWRVFPPRAGSREDLAARYRSALADPDALHLVVEVDGRVVGTAFALVGRPSSVSDERAVELSGVFVEPPYRRRGIGTALVAEVAGFARRAGVRRVTLKTFAGNEASLRYWEGLGFRPRIVQLTATVEAIGRPSAGSNRQWPAGRRPI